MPGSRSASIHDFIRILAQAAQNPEVQKRGWEVHLAQRREGGVCIRRKGGAREHHVAHFRGRSSLAWPFLSESRPGVLLAHGDVVRAWGLHEAVIDVSELVSRRAAVPTALDVSDGVRWERMGETEPAEGGRLETAELEAAILARGQCTAADLARWGVSDLQCTDYALAGGAFWRPLARPLATEPEAREAADVGDLVVGLVHTALAAPPAVEAA